MASPGNVRNRLRAGRALFTRDSHIVMTQSDPGEPPLVE